MTSVAVPTPSLREVRAGLAELLHPISALHADLAQGWPVEVDRAAARRRVRIGRPAFDAIDVLHAVGDLRLPFHRATQAFERAGLASAEAALAARQQHLGGVLALGTSWLAGEPLPAQEPRRIAHRAAAVVARSVLHRSARALRGVVRGGRPDRATCPACGGPPEFSVASHDDRRLVCARCDTAWRTARTGCLGCSASEAPTVVRIVSPDIGYDLVVCNGCGRYLKERTRRGGTDLVIERALTAQLDAAAERRGLHL